MPTLIRVLEERLTASADLLCLQESPKDNTLSLPKS